MAQQVVVRLTDDIDGDGTAADETLSFALDGVSYVIDVSAAHAQDIRDALAPFLPYARRAKKSATKGASESRAKSTTPQRSTEETRAIRDWAASVGIHLAPRGRIPAHVIDRYQRRTAA